MKGEVLEVEIRDNGRRIYKANCPTNNQRKINNLFNILKVKFSICYKKIVEKKKEGWWDD